MRGCVQDRRARIVDTASRVELRARRLRNRGSILGRRTDLSFVQAVQFGAGAQPRIQRVTGTFLIDLGEITWRDVRENLAVVSWAGTPYRRWTDGRVRPSNRWRTAGQHTALQTKAGNPLFVDWSSPKSCTQLQFTCQSSVSSRVMRTNRLMLFREVSVSVAQDKQCACSCSHCYSGEAIRITYCECVFVALGMQHAMIVRRIFPSLACPSVQYFSTLCHKQSDFQKQNTEHKMCVLFFSTSFVWNISHSKNIWARYYQKCISVFI